MIYEYSCKNGHIFDRVLPVADYQMKQRCDCGAEGRRIISIPLGSYVQKECRYDSPIDGKPITSWKQRRDDLARSGCREYDPEMRRDADRFAKRSEAELDARIDASVDAQIDAMPSRKREQLENELKAGANATIERLTHTGD